MTWSNPSFTYLQQIHWSSAQPYNLNTLLTLAMSFLATTDTHPAHTQFLALSLITFAWTVPSAWESFLFSLVHQRNLLLVQQGLEQMSSLPRNPPWPFPHLFQAGASPKLPQDCFHSDSVLCPSCAHIGQKSGRQRCVYTVLFPSVNIDLSIVPGSQ